MFVRYFVDLLLPLEQAEMVLLDHPERWISGLARGAQARGERLLAEVGFGNAGRRVVKRVEIDLGRPLRYATKTVIPMTWRATGPGLLFPTLEADVEVAALGPDRSQLAVSARYQPPLGAVGRVVDRALLHRVAEAILKDFVDRIAERLLTPAAS
jgi:hypothetical protein